MSAQDVANDRAACTATTAEQELQGLKLAKQLAKLITTLADEARALLIAANGGARPPEVDDYIGDAINRVDDLRRSLQLLRR